MPTKKPSRTKAKPPADPAQLLEQCAKVMDDAAVMNEAIRDIVEHLLAEGHEPFGMLHAITACTLRGEVEKDDVRQRIDDLLKASGGGLQRVEWARVRPSSRRRCERLGDDAAGPAAEVHAELSIHR